jgi:hypothetical protein
LSSPADKKEQGSAEGRPWLTWWKLGVIAWLWGGAFFALGLLTGVGEVFLWVSSSTCIALGILFLAIDVVYRGSRPTFGIGEGSPKTNRWRHRAVVFPLVAVMTTSTAQIVTKVWPDSGSNVYFYNSQEFDPSQPCLKGQEPVPGNPN